MFGILIIFSQTLVFGSKIQVNDYDPDSTPQDHPAVVIDSTGNVFVAFQDKRLNSAGLYDIYFSRLLGDTFSNDVNLSQTDTINDKYPWMAVSDTNIYVLWQGTSDGTSWKVYFVTSHDGGITFSIPEELPGITVHNSTTSGVNDGPQPKIFVAGKKIYVVWVDDGTGVLRIKIARSDDGGNSFQDLGFVDKNPSNVNRDPDIYALNDSTVYVVWRWGTGGTNQDPHPWIAFAKSTDYGVTFTDSVIVLDDRSNVYRGNPRVSVNRSTGDIMVTWEDSRRSGGNATPDIYFALSTDDGESFGQNIRVSNWPSACDNYRSAFSTDINGNTAIVWNADPVTNDSFSIYLCAYADGNFGEPQSLYGTYTGNNAGSFGNNLYPPSIKVNIIDSTTYFYMVWQDYSEDPNGNIYYIKGKVITTKCDIDVYRDTLDVSGGIIDFDSLPAGPAYVSKYFLVVNADSINNPDTTDGYATSRVIRFYCDPIILRNSASGDTFTGFLEEYPRELGVGEQAICRLTLYIPEGKHTGDYTGTVILKGIDPDSSISKDSVVVVVHGPYPEENLDSLKVFPNPYKPGLSPEKIYFEGITSDATVNVYDLKGRRVFHMVESNNDGLISWDITGISSGVYVYVVKTSSGAIRKGKIAIIK